MYENNFDVYNIRYVMFYQSATVRARLSLVIFFPVMECYVMSTNKKKLDCISYKVHGHTFPLHSACNEGPALVIKWCLFVLQMCDILSSHIQSFLA